MSIVRRIIGGIIVVAGLVGLGFGLYSISWLQSAAARTERSLVSGLDFGLEALETVSDTLRIAVQTVDDTALILDAAAESSRATAETLDAIRPAVQQIADVVAFDLPENIYAIQLTMPALEQAAAAIDDTLRTLARFQWSAVVPIVNYELSLGLGIEYDPDVPLDQSVAAVSAALGQLPSHLVGIQSDLLGTQAGLAETRASVDQIGQSLATVSDDLYATSELLQEYEALVSRAAEHIGQVRRTIRDQVQSVRLVLSGILVWLVLSQLAPLYLGCTLLAGRDNGDRLEVSTHIDGPSPEQVDSAARQVD